MLIHFLVLGSVAVRLVVRILVSILKFDLIRQSEERSRRLVHILYLYIIIEIKLIIIRKWFFKMHTNRSSIPWFFK